MLMWDQFGIIQSFQRSPIPQTSKWSGTFLYTRYSKAALVKHALTYGSLLLHQQDALKTQSQECYVLKCFSSKREYATIYEPKLFEFLYPRPCICMQCALERRQNMVHTHIYEKIGVGGIPRQLLAEVNEEREQKKFLDLIALVHHIDAMRYGLGTAPATNVRTCSVALPPCQYVPQACFFLSFVRHARKPTNDQ